LRKREAAIDSYGRQSVRRRAVANLPLIVPAPAVCPAAACETASAEELGAEADEHETTGHNRWRQAIGRGSVPKFTEDWVR